MVVKSFKIGGQKKHFMICEESDIVAWFEDLESAAVVCRFIKGGHMQKTEYEKAVKAMRAFDNRPEGSGPEGEMPRC